MWFAQDSLTTYTYTTNDATGAGAAGLFAGVMLLWMFVMLALIVVQIIAMWKIFVKAGVEGWKSIIPFYNYWVLCEIVGKPGWWGLTPILMAIPIVNFIAWIPVVILFVIVSLELGKAFGKDTVWSVFLLVIFSLIGLLILGFGSDKYQKPAVASASDAPTPQA